MSKIQRPKRLGGVAKAALAAAAIVSIAAPAYAWWEDGYAYRTKINLNTQAAGVTTEVARAPVLVRLHSRNFNFADAKPDGSDLRFVAGDDRTPLPFHVERWDAQQQQALVWVDVSGLRPGAPAAIYAYYGNADARPGQNVAGTFGPDYRAVYHFADEGAATDATSNGLNASGGAGRNSGGLIGNSLVLDGTTPLTLPANAIAAGPTSITFWVKPAAGASADGGQLLGIPGSATLTVAGGSVFLEQGGQRSAGAPLSSDGWTHVALVNDGQATRLFVGRQPAGEIAGALPAPAGPAVIGQGFQGEIDELRIAGVALPLGALELAAASEGVGPRLLTFDTAEQTEDAGHNYFGVLIGALTPDAWAVIVLLAIMSAISWWVMVTKGLFLGRTASANDDFLEAYAKSSAGRSEHDGLPDFDPGPKGASSSLAHLYRVGQRELQRRVNEGGAQGSRYAIRPQAIAAIRSALDAAHVREHQRLNKWMVLLTIAISGGPFLGLLGTVVGVMITFAAVAAAGDVNINAIAPGIAAALLATVAGLAVAIPALFGYNWLLSRVTEIDTDNQIFVDELEKRIAETWQDNDGPSPRSGRTPHSAIAAE